MMRDKRGLSEVVTTLIIILLVLVAIGIVWAVVSNILQSGSQQTENAAKCLQVDIKATAAQCTAGGVCNVTYRRSTGGDAVDGIVIVFSNGQTSNQTDVAGNVPVPATRTLTNFATGLSPVPNAVEVAAYFVDTSGKQQLCATTGKFQF